MGVGMAFLAGLRVLVVIVTAAGIGLGAWALTMVRSVENRGPIVLNSLSLEADMEIFWRRFFDAVAGSEMRFWATIASASFAFLASLFVFISMKIDRLKLSHNVLILLEFLSMFAMAAAFGTSLSVVIGLDTPCFHLDAASSSDLKTFEMLCPLSKGYAIGNGTGGFLLTVTSLVALISRCVSSRAPESCSFEPTASGLGMGHGYQAVVPSMPRATIPTIYDPLKPVPGTPKRPLREDEMGLAEKGAGMGMRESIDAARRSEEAEISGPLGLQRPEAVQNMRAKRPWSEMPRRE